MKQVIAQAIVAVLLVLVVGFFVWMFRARRAARASGATALAALAGTLARRTSRALGPACTARSAGDAARSLKSAARAQTTPSPTCIFKSRATRGPQFQVHRSESGLASIAPPDLVKTEDQEFDVQLIVGSTDADRAKRLLSPDLRRRLLDWLPPWGAGWHLVEGWPAAHRRRVWLPGRLAGESSRRGCCWKSACSWPTDWSAPERARSARPRVMHGWSFSRRLGVRCLP